jgi:predicted DNA binding CopG/RHH family protein
MNNTSQKSEKIKALDATEKTIMEADTRGEYQPVAEDEFQKRKAKLEQMAKATMQKVRKPISFKPDPDILVAFKEKAEHEGLPYQTLLNFLMKQYVDGNFKLVIAHNSRTSHRLQK